MPDGDEMGSASLLEKVTLLAVADLATQGETPSYPFDVRTAIRDCIESIADDVIGMPDEAAVSRALKALEARNSVVVADADDRSPVGKGRPAYTLDVDPEAVLDGLAADERLETAIAEVRANIAG